MPPKRTANLVLHTATVSLQTAALPGSVYAQHLAQQASQLAATTARQGLKRDPTDAQVRMLNGLGAVPGPMLYMKQTPAQINALKLHGETYQSSLRTMTGDDAARPVPGTMRSMLIMLGDTVPKSP
ncbi:hypothetical protein PLESTB_000675800 [Pleodorina starrii]|uniref:DUF4142 domain-containing protein n=1 Tax=Pleodorina starrii TaxID=330485 RepID=A0A9W6BJE9_9CHLO|nr:hypothetical protein PLESTB_000675800 [Pleodorina starrii]